MNTLKRFYHTRWLAIWNHEIDSSREEHDWGALDHAIDRRNFHEYRLALLRK